MLSALGLISSILDAIAVKMDVELGREDQRIGNVTSSCHETENLALQGMRDQ